MTQYFAKTYGHFVRNAKVELDLLQACVCYFLSNFYFCTKW